MDAFKLGDRVVWSRPEGDMPATIIGHSPGCPHLMPWLVRFDDGQLPVWACDDELSSEGA